MKRAWLVAAVALLAAPAVPSTASAQSMYRCGNTYQDKPCADGAGRVVGTPNAPAPSERASPPPLVRPPKPPPPSAADVEAASEKFKREYRPVHEQNMSYYREQCARGVPGFCISVACEPLVYDDSDAALITCIKARGYRMGNGWYTPSGWEQTPEAPRSEWRITIECISKVGGQRPYENLYRKYDAPEQSVNLEAEAARICSIDPAARRRK